MSENGHKNFRSVSASGQFEWTQDRVKAAAVLASGGTQDEAAAEAECTDRTIRNWLQEIEFAEEVDRLSLMVGIASRAERLRLAMRVVKQKISGNEVKTDKDLLEWLKFAQSETDGIKLDLGKVASAFGETKAPVADRGSTGEPESETVN